MKRERELWVWFWPNGHKILNPNYIISRSGSQTLLFTSISSLKDSILRPNSILGLKIESLRLDFCVLIWPNFAWHVHMELESLRLEFHTSTSREIWPLGSWASEIRFAKSEIESQKLSFGLLKVKSSLRNWVSNCGD